VDPIQNPKHPKFIFSDAMTLLLLLLQQQQRAVVGAVVVAFLVTAKALTNPPNIRLRHPRPWNVLLDSKASFDFSSTAEWEKFYQDDDDRDDQGNTSRRSNNNNNNNNNIEWHASVSLESIYSYVPGGSSVLMVGCGTSRLPDLFRHSSHRVTMLDSSSSCINRLQKKYDSLPWFECVCANALELSKLGQIYDVIIDKGLMDVFLCDGGWDSPSMVPRLLSESSSILRENGMYLLISYKLPTATRQFLNETGNAVGLEWKFHGEGSNDRVSISVATKRILPSLH
jgi:hypothetical protein